MLLMMMSRILQVPSSRSLCQEAAATMTVLRQVACQARGPYSGLRKVGMWMLGDLICIGFPSFFCFGIRGRSYSNFSGFYCTTAENGVLGAQYRACRQYEVDLPSQLNIQAGGF